MLDFTRELHEELLLKLKDFETNNNSGIFPDQRLEFIITALEKIREKLKGYPFAGERDEIHFFKSVLPPILSLFIYYSDKTELDLIELRSSPKSRYEYYDRIFTKTEDFFKENAEFIRYNREGKTELDPFYFLRNSPMNRERTYQLISVMDHSFATIHCVKLATFLAYTRLGQEMHLNISDKKDGEPPVISDDDKLTWTDSKIALIELIYSLKEQGAFNHGKASLKKINGCFEKTFFVDLGNVSRQFQDILARKTGYTNYLDKLRDKLQKGIDDIEQDHIR
jgi:hypothetical protein